MSADGVRLLPRKRLEIFVEAPLLHRIVTALDALGAPGYSLLQVVGGRGRGTAWADSSEIGNTGRMVCIISLVEPEQVESILSRVSGIVAGRSGVTAMSDVGVLAAGDLPK